MEDNFPEMYERVRRVYDELVYKEGNSPMKVFGVMLGIVAQEFKENSTKEEFDRFLTEMMNVDWKQTVN